MPLTVWIDAMVDNDTSKIKDFEGLYTQFCEAIGGTELKIRMSENADMVAIKAKVMIGEMCINMLNARPSEKVYNILKDLGYQNSGDAYTPENCDKLVKQVEPFVKLDAVDLQVMLNHTEKGDNGMKYTRDYFTDMLIEMSTAFKVTLTDNMSVRAYCRWVVKYKNYIDLMNKQNIQ